MPALPKNPSSMTKERLIQELKKNNISLPRSNSRKEVYVELYQRHLLDDDPRGRGETGSTLYTTYRHAAMNTSPRFGFSSDEEEEEVVMRDKKAAVLNANNSNRKRASKKGLRPEFENYLAEIEDLSDAQLKKELRNRGVMPGPIVATTRAVYERKLASLLLEEEGEYHDKEEEDVSQEEEGVSQEEEVDEELAAAREQNEYSDSDVDRNDSETRASSRTVGSRTSSSKSRTTRVIEQESSSQMRQRSSAPESESAPSAETTSKTTKPKSKSLVPVWLQILIFLIVAAFLVLIWYNMETTVPGKPLVT